MERPKRGWLITIIVIAVIAAILIGVLWYNGNHENSAHGNKENTPAAEGDTNSTTGSIQDDLLEYMDDQDDIMSDMMEDMGDVKKSGNASVYFLKGMIPHHESAIEMSESYLENGGQNSELKKLAEDIITAQTKEILDMNSMIKRIEDSGKKDEEKEQRYLEEYGKMMSSHQSGGHAGHSSSANVEQAFAEGMIMHHQMAVDMAEDILEYTDEDDVKSLAQTIIDTQEEEIRKMQEIVDKLK